MSSSSFVPEVVKGQGVWASGRSVREIEGHFHPENEPKNATPISGDGGVPNVDFKDRVKDAVTGHHGSHSNTTGSGLTGSSTYGSGSGSGLTGSSTTHGSGSGLTGTDSSNYGTNAGLASGATSGLTGHNSTHTGTSSSSGLTGAGHSSSTTHGSGLTGHDSSASHNNNNGQKKEGIVEKVKDVITGNKDQKDLHDPARTGDVQRVADHQQLDHSKVGSVQQGSSVPIGQGPEANYAHGSSATTGAGLGAGALGAGALASGSHTGTGASPLTTGTSHTATSGATHGISDSAERQLHHDQAGSHGTTGLLRNHGDNNGGTGVVGNPIAIQSNAASGTGTGITGAHSTAPGQGGIASALRNDLSSSTNSNRTGDSVVGGGARTGDVSALNTTGATHTTPVATHGATGAHGTTGVTGASHTTESGRNTPPKKEGFLAKIKHALE